MTKKTCLITGANSGIGKPAAIQIARKGYHLIMACRNRSRGEVAQQEIRERGGSDSVDLTMVDMSLQSSIREFAADLLSKYDVIDVLIHNAAAFDTSQKAPIMTDEGILSFTILGR